MARATGIEITGSTVRVTELDGSARKAKVVGTAEVAIDEEASGSRKEAIQAALKTAFKASRAKKEHVVFGVPARETVIREILIPFTDVDQIRKVVKFESESHLHGVEIDDVVVDFHKIGEVGARSRVLIAAVRKETLQDYLDILGRVGIDPSEIDLDAGALFSRAQQIEEIQAEGEGAYAIMDLGDQTSTIVVGRDEKLNLVRCVRLGTETITRSISQDLGVEREEARTMTLQLLQNDTPFAAGEGESPEMSSALTATQIQTGVAHEKELGLARRLVTELRRSLSSSQLEGRLQTIYLTGPAAASIGVERALVDAFQVPVVHLDVLQGMEHMGLDGRQAATMATSCGLALKALGHDPLGFDFRKEELRFTKRFEKIETPLLVLGFLSILLFVILGFEEVLHIREKNRLASACAKQAKKIFEQDVMGSVAGQPKKLAILGLKNKDQIIGINQGVLKRPEEKWIVGYSNYLSDLITKVHNAYGIKVDDDTAVAPEEQVVSALERCSQFFTALKAISKNPKFGEGCFALSSLTISSEDVRWDMKINNLDIWPALEAEFQKLEGYEGCERGNRKPQEGEWSLLQSCRLDFVKES